MELKLHIKKLIPVANIGVRMLLASWQFHSTAEVLSCSVSTLSLSQVSTFHQNLLLEVGIAPTGITALWAKGVTALHQDFLQEKSSEKWHIRLLSHGQVLSSSSQHSLDWLVRVKASVRDVPQGSFRLWQVNCWRTYPSVPVLENEVHCTTRQTHSQQNTGYVYRKRQSWLQQEKAFG